VNYRITELNEWVIVHPSGKAQNNEPLRVKYLFNRWLTQKGIRVIVNLKELSQLGVWGMGLLTSCHGRISATPLDDIDRAMANAEKILDGRIEGGPEIFFQKN
jgi:hypothetical protein